MVLCCILKICDEYSKNSTFFPPDYNEFNCDDEMNPCGNDAYCNRTKFSLFCECRLGFQRNKASKQCEGSYLVLFNMGYSSEKIHYSSLIYLYVCVKSCTEHQKFCCFNF